MPRESSPVDLRIMRCVLLVATASTLAPRVAAAEWLVTPFIGWQLGGAGSVSAGAARDNGFITFDPAATYGVSVERAVSESFAVEFDLAQSPHAFGNSTSEIVSPFTADSKVTTIAGNVMVTAHDRSLHSYAVAGLAMLRTTLQGIRQTSASTKNDLGMDVGAGLTAFVARHVGIRGDVRYFRSFRSADAEFDGLALAALRFWRVSGGVSLKF
jgi:opacity protein-like surface antigen